MGSGDAPRTPIGDGAIHLCIDMQRLFSAGAPWGAEWFDRRLPAVIKLVERNPHRTIFTRFIPPNTPEEMPGMWRRYFERWRKVTRTELDLDLLRLAPELERYAPPAIVIDKSRYSPFATRGFAQYIAERSVDTIVISGCESDVCVLATALDAIDIGFRVVIVTDAICSSSDEGHDAIMSLYHRRFSQQVETAIVETVLDAWPQAD